jgi:hypothetical protein
VIICSRSTSTICWDYFRGDILPPFLQKWYRVSQKTLSICFWYISASWVDTAKVLIYLKKREFELFCPFLFGTKWFWGLLTEAYRSDGIFIVIRSPFNSLDGHEILLTVIFCIVIFCIGKYLVRIDCGSLFGKIMGLNCTLELNQGQFWILHGQAIMQKYKIVTLAARYAKI